MRPRTWMAGALLLAACLGPPTGAVEGQVVLHARAGGEAPLGPIEVSFIPEELMKPYVERKTIEARAALQHAEAKLAGLEREVLQLSAARLDADQELRSLSGDATVRRLSLAGKASSPQELESHRSRVAAQRSRARQRVAEQRRLAFAAERELAAARETVSRIKQGALLTVGVPAAAFTTTTHLDGRFEARLLPGRYAVVAAARGPDGAWRTWLLWTQVAPAGVSSLRLSEANEAGSECADCVFAASRFSACRER